MAAEDESRKLSDIFDDGLDLFNTVSKTDEATNSSNIQVCHCVVHFIIGERFLRLPQSCKRHIPLNILCRTHFLG